MLDGRRTICTESNSEDSEVQRGEDENEVDVEEVVDEEEADTDLETDRLLGQQRTDDQGFYDDKVKQKNNIHCCNSIFILCYLVIGTQCFFFLSFPLL